MNNLWEVAQVIDVIRILKESQNKFVILFIVLDSTPESMRVFMRKFLKYKSKVYPNMTFLFYKASHKDLGKSILFKKDPSKYPYAYYIWNSDDIYIEIANANEESILKTFERGEDAVFKQQLNKYLCQQTPKLITEQPMTTCEPTPQLTVHQIMGLDKNQTSNDVCADNNMTVKETTNVNDKKNGISEQDKLIMEQQKQMEEYQTMIEKIVNLQQKRELYEKELLRDIAQRKKEEEKLRRKDKN